MTVLLAMTEQVFGKRAAWEDAGDPGREAAAGALDDWASHVREQEEAHGGPIPAVEFAINVTGEIAEDLRAGCERARDPLTLHQVPPVIAMVNAMGPMIEHLTEHPSPGVIDSFLALSELATVWGRAAETTRAASGWTPDQACQEPCCQGNLVAAVWRTELQQRALRADLADTAE